MFLRVGTSATVVLGPFVDDTDGKTAETGLTIAQADVRLSKNGGAFAQKSSATSCSHLENGYYSCALDTTDSGTTGHLRVAVNKSGALPVWRDFLILPANVYDSLVAATDKLQVHTDELTASIITAGTIGPDAFTAAKFAADVTTELQNGLATAAALQTVDDLVDTLIARLTAARAGYLDKLEATAFETAVEAAAIGAIEATIGSDGASLTEIPWNSAWDAEVQSEAADALAAYDPPTKAEVDTVVHAKGDAILAALSIANDLDATEVQAAAAAALAAAGVTTTVTGRIDAAISTRLATAGYTTPPTAAAMWEVLTSGLTTAGSIGKLLADNVNATISSRLATAGYTAPLSAADVRSALGMATGNLDTQLGDLPTNSELSTALAAADDTMLAAIAGLNNLNAAGIRAALGMAAADLDAQLANIPTLSEMNARTLAAADYFDPAVDKVLLAATTHTNAIIPTVTAVTNAVTLTSAYDAAKTAAAAGAAMTLANDAISAAALHSGATAEIVAALLGATVPGAYGAGTVGYLVGTHLNATIGDLPSAADLRDQVDAAIEAYRLDELLYGPMVSAPDSTSLFGELTENNAGTQRFTALALAMGPMGEGASPVTIAAEVWNSVIDNFQIAGSAGEALLAGGGGGGGDPWETTLPGSYTGSQAGAMLSSILTRANALPLASAIRTELETAGGKLDLAHVAVTSGTLFSNVGAIKTKTDALPSDWLEAADIPTVAQIRAEMDANSTRLQSIHGSVQTLEELVDAGGTLYNWIDAVHTKVQTLPADPAATADIPTAAAIAAQVLGSTVPGAYGAGTLGHVVGNRLDAAVSSLDASSSLATILAKVNPLPAQPASVGDLLTAAQVESILVEMRLDQLLAGPAANPATNSVLYQLSEQPAGVWRFRAAALSQAPAGGGGGTANVQDIIDGLLDEPTAAHTGMGTVGGKLHSMSNLTQSQVRDAVWLVGPDTHGQIPDTYGWMLDTRVSGMLANEAGTGSVPFVYTVTNSLNSQVIEDVIVTVTSDEAGQVVIARARTNEDGEATFHLNPGDYYLWRAKSGWNFANPDTESIE